MNDLNVIILGSGIIGMVSALEIKKELRNANVTIIANQFLNETTSSVAAGIFRPPTGLLGATKEITKQWIQDSFYYWDGLRKAEDPFKTGLKEISGYIFSSEYPHITRNEYLENLLPIYRKTTETELKICPGNWKYGSFFKTILTDPTLLLPWLTANIQLKNIKTVRKKIDNFRDISEPCDVLVNCTGLGAKILCNDNKLVALRGQVLKVNDPHITNFYYGDYDTYIIPGFKSVTLGGCRQYESYNLKIDKYDTESIRERCTNLVPSLKNAPITSVNVGLRPHRSVFRIEKENLLINGKTIRIVHNYGHGGYGYTTAPGTALYALKLVKESLSGNSKL